MNKKFHFETIFILFVGVMLLIFGIMKGDVGRYIGGDTPLVSVMEVLGGLYLLYLAYLRWKSTL